MAPDEWRLPMRCPDCHALNGLPFKTQTTTTTAVLVSMRCSQCHHEWAVQRATPLFRPKPDRRRESRDEEAT